LLGNGDGTLKAVTTIDAGAPGGTALVLADVNGDSILDIVATNVCTVSHNCLLVLLGNGNGTFKKRQFYPLAGYSSLGLAIADVNHDGKLDAVTGACGSSNCFGENGVVSVLLGNGNGTFQTAIPYDSGGRLADEIALGDVTGDGNIDIVVAN